MVIGAFVLARLLGLRLLTLEARVVVHEDDGGGSGAIILSQAPPDRPALDPDPPSRRVRLERPGQPGRRDTSDRLARAVQLVERGGLHARADQAGPVPTLIGRARAARSR